MINQLNVNDESCTNHFHQWAMVEAIRGDQTGAQTILAELKQRRDAALLGLNAIAGIDIVTPECTFYLFPNITRIMNQKGITSLDDLQIGALHNSGVSFCTREHFGRPQEGEQDYYIRFAYSGISVEDIAEGMGKLKDYFES